MSNDEKPQIIQQQIDETRERLMGNLDKLSSQTVQTVQTVGDIATSVTETAESVQETVKAVSDTVDSVTENIKAGAADVVNFFNVSTLMESHPWLVLGGSVALGYMAGTMLAPVPFKKPSRQPVAGTDYLLQRFKTASENGNGSSRSRAETSSAKPAEESWTQGLLQTFGPALEQLKGMAIGAAVGMTRDVLTQSLQGDIGTQVRSMFDDVTKKLGGIPTKPYQFVQKPTTYDQGECDARVDNSEMDRPMGTSQWQSQNDLGLAHQ